MAELKTTSTMDNRGFVRGIDGMKKEVGGFESRLKNLKSTMAAAFSVGAATAFARSIAQYANEVSVAAQQSKLTTDQIQALTHAARDSGGEIDNVRGMLSSMREAMSDAVKNGGTMAQTFRNLGIETSQLAKMTEGQLLEALAKGYKETNNFTELVRVLGEEDLVRTESALVSLAENGFGKLIDAAQEAGQVMNREAIESAAAWDRALERAALRAKATAANLFLSGSELGEYGRRLREEFIAVYQEAGARINPGARGRGATRQFEIAARETGLDRDAAMERARQRADAYFDMRAETRALAAAQGPQTYDRQDPYAQLKAWEEQFGKLIPAFAQRTADAVASVTRPVVDRNVADNMERVGAYMGPVADAVRGPMERQQTRANQLLERIAKNTEPRPTEKADPFGGVSFAGP